MVSPQYCQLLFWLETTQPETDVVAFHAFINMAEAAQVEKRQGEASTSPVGDIVSPFAEFLGEMKQMNANITSMRGDLNNLVVENVSEHGSDISLSELNNEVDSPRHDTETISIDTKVERLLKETSGAQTSEDSSANPDSLLTTIAQELDVSEQMGAAVHSGLAPIVDGLLGSKLSDEKWREKVGKYPRPQNLGNLRTPRVNPLIWNQLSSGVRTNDAKQQLGIQG